MAPRLLKIHTCQVGTNVPHALYALPTDWNKIFTGFVAAVDEPASCFWEELGQAYPEALVLLSGRDSEYP